MKRSLQSLDDNCPEDAPPTKRRRKTSTAEDPKYPLATHELLNVDPEAFDAYIPPKHWEKVCPCHGYYFVDQVMSIFDDNENIFDKVEHKEHLLTLQILLAVGIKTDMELRFFEHHYPFIDKNQNLCLFMDDHSWSHQEDGYGFFDPKWNFVEGGCQIEVYSNNCLNFNIKFSSKPRHSEEFHRPYFYVLRCSQSLFQESYYGSFQQHLINLHFDWHALVDSRKFEHERHLSYGKDTFDFLTYSSKYLPKWCGCPGKYYISRLCKTGTFADMFKAYCDPRRMCLGAEFLLAYTLYQKDSFLKQFEQTVRSCLLQWSLDYLTKDIVTFAYYDFSFDEYVEQFPYEFEFTKETMKYHSIVQGIAEKEYIYFSNSVEYESPNSRLKFYEMYEDMDLDQLQLLLAEMDEADPVQERIKRIHPLFEDYFPYVKDLMHRQNSTKFHYESHPLISRRCKVSCSS